MTDNNQLRRIAYTTEERVEQLEENQRELAQTLLEAQETIEDLQARLEEQEDKPDVEMQIEMPAPDTETKEQEEEEEQETDTETEDEASEGRGIASYNQDVTGKKNALLSALELADSPLKISEAATQAWKEAQEIESSSKYYRRAHTLLKDLEHEGRVKDVSTTGRKRYAPVETEEQEQEDEDEETDTQEEQEIITDLPDLKQKLEAFTDTTQIDVDRLDTDTRDTKIIKAVQGFDVPLTISEITRLVYQLPEDVDVGDASKYRNRIQPRIYNLKEKGYIKKSDRTRVDVNGLANIYTDTDKEVPFATDETIEEQEEDEEEDVPTKEVETDTGEELEWERIKRHAGVRDSDMDIVVNAFDKVFNEQNDSYISYHKFEKHYEGDLRAMQMFQKLFENAGLLQGVMQRVVPDQEFKWKKKKHGQYDTGVKNWVVTVEP